MSTTAAATLSFDASTHTYTLDGEILPSVTQVLKWARLVDFSMIPQDVLQRAARRGTAVHMALHYLDEGDLDENTLAPEITGYVAAYQRFLEESRFKTFGIEQRVFDAKYHYAGTLDRTGEFPGGDLAIIDFKTGILLPGHALQIAAYQNCLESPRRYRRIVLQLREDGTYRAHEFPKGGFFSDLQIFLSALACVRWAVLNNSETRID